MDKKSDCKVYVIASVVAFFIFSVSFLLMPIEDGNTDNGLSLFSFAAGVMFWLGLIVGSIMQLVLSIKRKNWLSKHKQSLCTENQPRIGIISFFKNKIAIAFDVVFILSWIGFVFSLVLTNTVGYVCYVFAGLVSFSFCAHCIFNGKNYFFVKN